ncbi:uncharacterized protein LOC139922549 [Centroberyx gerrardi]
MSLSLLLLLLLLQVCGSQASHFFGTMMTFNPKNVTADGAVTVVLRYKLSFRSCTDDDTWDCVSGDCGTESLLLDVVDQESSEEWCQIEGVMIRQVSTNAPFQLRLDGGDWISNIQNGVSSWRALTLVDLRIRSDTDRVNRSPQTTILPALRVPSNCQRDFNLLAFDPDGDEVKCRYGNTAEDECSPCTPPSVLSISQPCTLSFHTTSSSNEGPYAIQLVLEDFPNQAISLTQTNGLETRRTTDDALSKLPVQFVVKVDSAAPSCTEGHYLPKFLPPTPADRAHLYAPVNESLEITINAEATNSQVSEILYSAPQNSVSQPGSVAGQFILSWTPTEGEEGEDHPICFVVQAVNDPNKYHSELRCVIVSVINQSTTTALPSTFPPITTAGITTRANTTQVNLTDVLDESRRPDGKNSDVGKVIGIVFAVGIAIALVVGGVLAARNHAKTQSAVQQARQEMQRLRA